jgi:hypothetical protein
VRGEDFIFRVLLLNEVGKFVGDGDKIDNASAGDFETSGTGAIRLDLLDFGEADFLDAFDTVLEAVIVDAFKAGELF